MPEDRRAGKPGEPDDEREDAAEIANPPGLEPPASLDEALEAPPEAGPAEAYHQRARLAEVLAA